MPRLFIKIFLWFWLAVTLIGAILVTIALNTNPRQAFIERQKSRLTGFGNELIQAYEEYGHEGLTASIKNIYEKEQVRLALIHIKTRSLGMQPEQPHLKDFIRKALLDNLTRPYPNTPRVQSSMQADSYAIPLDKDYVLLAEVPKPSQLELILDPEALTLRLTLTFLVAGLICYMLARSITAPIFKLRQATQSLAGGNLSTRVTPQLEEKRGELFDLAKDFDTMAERIETLLQSQQRLMRDISHELRSPLSRLNIALELARQKTAENSAPLDRIEKESERLNELIAQLLTITRLENQTEIKDKDRIDLTDILTRIIADANFESQGSNRSAKLTVIQPVTLYGSQEMLYRAIENVVRNCLWYTAEGTAVEVILDKSKDGKGAEIAIRDHGPGVPDGTLEHIFRPFYRVGESRCRKSGGAGVGLAIAERAIKLHGGRISAANAAEGGLFFLIFLPFERHPS